MNTETLWAMSSKELKAQLASGHAIDPEVLNDTEYRGVSLGLPAWVERLTWKTFMKTFHRDPATGRLRGWNVKLEQDGLDAGPRAKVKKGQPLTFGHYEVVPGQGRPGLLIHYGLGKNSALDPARLLRDPIVAIHAGSAELLLGWSYLDLGFAVPTPSYFTLERVGPLSHVV